MFSKLASIKMEGPLGRITTTGCTLVTLANGSLAPLVPQKRTVEWGTWSMIHSSAMRFPVSSIFPLSVQLRVEVQGPRSGDPFGTRKKSSIWGMHLFFFRKYCELKARSGLWDTVGSQQ